MYWLCSADTAQQAVSCQTVSLAINMSNTEMLGSTIIFPLPLAFSRLLPGDSVTHSDSVWTLLAYSHNLGVSGRRRVQWCKCSYSPWTREKIYSKLICFQREIRTLRASLLSELKNLCQPGTSSLSSPFLNKGCHLWDIIISTNEGSDCTGAVSWPAAESTNLASAELQALTPEGCWECQYASSLNQ